MILTGLIGHPVTQSLSARIHAHWRTQQGITGHYEAIDIMPGKVRDGVLDLIHKGFIGLNVTVPHKVEALAVCDTLSPEAVQIGAVNTLHFKKGKIEGHNTDSYGFVMGLAAHAKACAGKEAVVLGSGGAARAVIHGIASLGISKIRVVARRAEAAQDLMSIAPITFVPWEERAGALAGAGLLVNTTSLGMTGKEPLDLDITTLSCDAVVCDIVYKPLMTVLLSAAQAQGHPIVTGLPMLCHQAARAFEIWHGVLPPVTRALEQNLMAG